MEELWRPSRTYDQRKYPIGRKSRTNSLSELCVEAQNKVAPLCWWHMWPEKPLAGYGSNEPSTKFPSSAKHRPGNTAWPSVSMETPQSPPAWLLASPHLPQGTCLLERGHGKRRSPPCQEASPLACNHVGLQFGGQGLAQIGIFAGPGPVTQHYRFIFTWVTSKGLVLGEGEPKISPGRPRSGRERERYSHLFTQTCTRKEGYNRERVASGMSTQHTPVWPGSDQNGAFQNSRSHPRPLRMSLY